MQPNESPLEQLFLKFAQYCQDHHLEYVYVGGITVQWLGTPRTTFDIDIILILPSSREPEFIEFLQNVDPQFNPKEIHQARQEHRHFSVFYPSNPMFRYDIRLADKPQDYAQVQSAMIVDYKGTPIRMNSPEHAIIFKLVYGSEQDINDAASILVRQRHNINFKQLNALAREKKVIDRLNALTDALNDDVD